MLIRGQQLLEALHLLAEQLNFEILYLHNVTLWLMIKYGIVLLEVFPAITQPACHKQDFSLKSDNNYTIWQPLTPQLVKSTAFSATLLPTIYISDAKQIQAKHNSIVYVGPGTNMRCRCNALETSVEKFILLKGWLRYSKCTKMIFGNSA